VRVTVTDVSLGRMLTRAEAASALEVSARRRGQLSVYRFGGRPRFQPADVVALREARSTRTRSAA
jgi:hypothetical protein